ncbi:hypothetical protein I553_1714, partial [Mycobacterium xenopi 4042]
AVVQVEFSPPAQRELELATRVGVRERRPQHDHASDEAQRGGEEERR